MKLRDRLLLFSLAQLVGFGVLFVATYAGFRMSVLPALEEHLRSKTDITTAALADRLDVALGADDRAMIRRFGDQPFADDATVAYVEIDDAHGVPVFQRGSDLAGVRAARDVTFEGVALGRVTVVFDTVELDQLRAWTAAILALVLVVWLAAAAYSIRFSRAFVAPIRAMKDFSHAVAHGDFTRTLEVDASAELLQLRDDLNAMARELASRDRERQASALRTEQLQRELVLASRAAGMAEVATGVLHNVGNVLNSLNVSVSVVDAQLRASRVPAFARQVRAFAEHPGGLASFLATERGKLVPEYLASLARHLGDENTQALAELAAVTGNVEHIKTIVTAQQSYALTSDLREPVELAGLVEDALRMGAAAFAENGVEVVREYGDVPPVMTDRHGVLQSLINLVGNARHALLETATAARRLVVRVRRSGENVAIDIIDNGIGIGTAQLPRIFEHGFTTKKRGHGFGLHSSANAIRAIGGSISVASAGHGLGATFTIELPLAQPEGTHARPA